MPHKFLRVFAACRLSTVTKCLSGCLSVTDMSNSNQFSAGETRRESAYPFSGIAAPATESSDEELVSRAQTGDKDALDKLVRRHQPWVFNISIRMLWHREVAEDATQEILIKVVTKLSTFRGQSQFRTWLYRIAVNHLLNVRKSEA